MFVLNGLNSQEGDAKKKKKQSLSAREEKGSRMRAMNLSPEVDKYLKEDMKGNQDNIRKVLQEHREREKRKQEKKRMSRSSFNRYDEGLQREVNALSIMLTNYSIDGEEERALDSRELKENPRRKTEEVQQDMNRSSTVQDDAIENRAQLLTIPTANVPKTPPVSPQKRFKVLLPSPTS